MHIVIDCRYADCSGIGRYISEILPRLVKNDAHKYTLLVASGEASASFREKCPGTETGFIECSSRMYSVKEQFEIPLKVPACDVFWSPHYNAPFLPVKAKVKIVTIHDLCHLRFQEGMSLVKKLYAKAFMGLSSRFYDQIFTVSEFTKNEIIKYERVPAEKICVHKLSADVEKYRRANDPIAAEAVKEKYCLPKDYFLFVGNVKPHKNIRRLLQAYAGYAKDTENPWSLAIVGKKEGLLTGENGLEEIIDESGVKELVNFTGFVEDDDLPLFYRAAEAFVFPSLYEGFGLPPLEAMACDCPVVASNAASIPEVLGDAAYYFNSYSEAEISAALKEVSQNERLRNELREKGARRLKLYSWDKTAQEVMESLENIAKERICSC